MSKNSKTDLDNISTSNSLELGDNNLDQNVKYEKVIQDYVKLRSKLTILKKAYVELSEASAQKDQSIRKYEQELEGLNFRNQQLTARVEILQRELETKSNPVTQGGYQSNNDNNLMVSSSSSTTSTLSTSSSYLTSSTKSTQPSLEILAEELQHKINENQSLHRRLNELEVDLRQKLVKNEQSLKQIEYEKLILEKKVESIEISSKATIEKLENDKIKLELTIIQLENQLRATHQEKEMKESELLRKESEHNLLKQQHAELHKNSSSSSLNSMSANSPTKKENIHHETLSSGLKSLVDSLKKFYVCLDERLSKKSLPKLALKCEQTIQQVENSFKNLNLKNLEQKFDEFLDSNHKLFQSIMSDLVNGASSDSDEMQKLKKKLKIYLNKIDQFFFLDDEENFSQYLKKLLSLFLKSPTEISFPNDKLTSSLKTFVDLLDKLLFALNEKLALEYSLEYSSEKTTSDECLVSYLTQIKQLVNQMVSLGESVGISELIVQFRNELKEEFKNNNSNGSIVNDKEIENLTQIINDKDLELKKFEERYEILRLKSEKDDQDINELKSKLEKLQGELIKLEESEKQNQLEIFNLKNCKLDVKNEITSIENPREQVETVEDLDIELKGATIEIYQKQIESLNKRIQYLDSKAMYYYDEMKCLLERLSMQIDANNLKTHDLNEIKDQLERTRSSYEIQMSTMSDHLIEMTDRMTKQAEENEKLKHDLSLAFSSTAAVSSQANSKNSKSKKSK